VTTCDIYRTTVGEGDAKKNRSSVKRRSYGKKKKKRPHFSVRLMSLCVCVRALSPAATLPTEVSATCVEERETDASDVCSLMQLGETRSSSCQAVNLTGYVTSYNSTQDFRPFRQEHATGFGLINDPKVCSFVLVIPTSNISDQVRNGISLILI
jgi:hypothetical protein